MILLQWKPPHFRSHLNNDLCVHTMSAQWWNRLVALRWIDISTCVHSWMLRKNVCDEVSESFGVLLGVDSGDFCTGLQHREETRQRAKRLSASCVHVEHENKQCLPSSSSLPILTPCLTVFAAWAAFFFVSYWVRTSIRPMKYTSLWGAPEIRSTQRSGLLVSL